MATISVVERAAVDSAREAIARGVSFSRVAAAVAAVSRESLRRELLQYMRERDAEGEQDGPWLEAHCAWNLAGREVPVWLPFVRSLDLWRCHELDAPAVRWLGSLAGLRDVRRLRLDECGLTEDVLVAFAAAEVFPRIHTLTLLGNFPRLRPCTGSALAQLFALDWGRELRTLDISNNALTPDAYEALGRAPALHQVRSLRVCQRRIGAAAMRALLRRGAWPGLTALAVADEECAQESLPALFDSPVAPRVVELTLSASGLTACGVAALVANLPRMGALVRLDLADNPLGDLAAELLAGANVPASLRRISLHRCGLSADGWAALGGARWAGQLEQGFPQARATSLAS